jgi:putative intracellular protease/amidase
MRRGPWPSRPAIDPRSGSADRVEALRSAWEKMQPTAPLAQLRLDDQAGVFPAGGHGTKWDFPDDAALKPLVERAFERGVPLGAVCHGPAGLLSAKESDGTFWIAGRRVYGFTNDEERAAGGRFESSGVFRRHVVVDGALVAGQNPASADAVAESMIELLRARSR